MIALGLVLLYDWLSLPNTPAARSGMSIAGAWRGSMHGRPVPIILYRTPKGLHAEVLGGDPMPSWEPVVDFHLFQDLRKRTGTWGLTHESQRLILVSSGDLTASEFAGLTPVLLDATDRTDEPLGRTAELLRSPGWTIARRLPLGYVHNAIAASLAALFATSAALGLPRIRRERRAMRWRMQGCCSQCGYSLEDAGPVCPECGTDGASEPQIPARTDP